MQAIFFMFVSNCIESWLGFWSIALSVPPATGRLCLVICVVTTCTQVKQQRRIIAHTSTQFFLLVMPLKPQFAD